MTFRVPVETGHILTFARAIGDDNPAFVDADAARSAGFPDVVAPPTFVEAGAHFDPHSIVRPLDGEPWFGSAAEPSGDPQHARREPGSTFHAETHFDYYRPYIVAGDVLTATERPGRNWSKVGRRGGTLGFKDWSVDYTDAAGNLAVTARTVAVTTTEKVPPPAGRVGQVDHHPAFDGLPDSGRLTEPPRASALTIGAVHEAVVLRGLTRTRIVQYAGASGDFSPQHTDEYYNVHSAGYPTVFAHGMLSMAGAGRLLTDWLGVGSLRYFGARFLGQVWPGDSLLARATVRDIDEAAPANAGRIELDVEVLDQYLTPVIRGSAVVELPS
jgi:peroxisomal enoyl-CoA hydratase 2